MIGSVTMLTLYAGSRTALYKDDGRKRRAFKGEIDRAVVGCPVDRNRFVFLLTVSSLGLEVEN